MKNEKDQAHLPAVLIENENTLDLMLEKVGPLFIELQLESRRVARAKIKEKWHKFQKKSVKEVTGLVARQLFLKRLIKIDSVLALPDAYVTYSIVENCNLRKLFLDLLQGKKISGASLLDQDSSLNESMRQSIMHSPSSH